ncbi:MAG: glycosyltransferase family 4 protein, partial [Pseudomonadota bacterium]
WYRRRAVRRVLRSVRPQRVLLDNYRSILLAPSVRHGAPRAEVIALVRDNRFTCTRHDQSQRIGGATCSSCRFDCAPLDAARHARWHRRHLMLSAAHRRRCLSDADRVIVTSAYLEDGIRRALPDAGVVRIPNPGGDLDEVAAHIRGVAEWPGQNLLIVGMLNENKGQLQFLNEAVDWLKADRRRRVHLAGRGDRIAARIRETAAMHGTADQIHLHGYLDRADLFRLARQCQVIVAPTVWPEPFGRVPLEAGLARRPIVAFARGGLRETILDNETGFLVAPGDYATLLDRVDQLLADPALAQRLGARAYAHIATLYSVDRVGEAFARLFDPADRMGRVSG